MICVVDDSGLLCGCAIDRAKRILGGVCGSEWIFPPSDRCSYADLYDHGLDGTGTVMHCLGICNAGTGAADQKKKSIKGRL